jgi:hypothetical protein
MGDVQQICRSQTQGEEHMNTKEELLALLRVCNAPPAAIDVAEAAYELGFRMGQLAGPAPQPEEDKETE